MGARQKMKKPAWAQCREYWSPRAGRHTALPWGPIGKWITHKKEHAARRRVEWRLRADPATFDNI